jgi:hypothetical protein
MRWSGLENCIYCRPIKSKENLYLEIVHGGIANFRLISKMQTFLNDKIPLKDLSYCEKRLKKCIISV